MQANNEIIKLLLVEDDEDFSAALVSRFKKRNFNVTVALSAEEALDKLKNFEPDAVVSDIKLPGMGGIEFLVKVRELYNHLPVILITGYASLESAKEAVKLNAADYLLKPLENIHELLDPIHKAVHGYKLEIENKRLTKQLRNKVAELEKAYQELKETQQQLIQSSKMAAMGQLASGIAHEINNPLTTILGTAEIMSMRKDENKDIKNLLKEIIEQAKRIKTITERLLDFSRKKEIEKVSLNPNAIVEKSISLISYQAKIQDVEIKGDLDPALPATSGDIIQLQEVFLNIMLNAVQSMEKGGTLTVKTRTEKVKEYTRRKNDTFKQGQEIVAVEFNDTGKGMDDETLKRIFEPFFTTKSKNTGLGLSICHGIVRNHKGAIEAYSKLNEGSTFTVKLPVRR